MERDKAAKFKTIMQSGALALAMSATVAGTTVAQPVEAPPAAPSPAAEVPTPFAAAKPGDVRVYMSPALRAAYEKVKVQAEAAVGKPIVVEIRQARLLQQGIEDGQAFEVALLTKPVMDSVVSKNRVIAATQVKLAEVPLGVAARGDLSKIDVKQSPSLKKAILSARTVHRNYGVGASVPLVEHMIKTLGVEDAIKPKIIPMAGATAPPPPLPPLAPGEYDLMFNMASELQARPGWTYIDAIPHELRLPTEFMAGQGPQGDQVTARKLMSFLKGPVFKQALIDTALEPAT